MRVENPPGAIVRNEITQAAYQNGWRIDDGIENGWFLRRSPSAPGRVALAGAGPQGPWFFAVDHPGIGVELKASAVDLAGPGIARFMILDTKELHAVLERTWDLAVSLPDHPLRRFEAETAGLPRNTEAERMVIQRRGQDVFRDSLLKYWGHRCPLTGITQEQLLRASHIKPWAVCDTDEERLDPYNGLLLSSLWDSAFDAGLVSFDDWGQILSSGHLTAAAQQTLGTASLISLSFQHLPYLQWHREHIFLG